MAGATDQHGASASTSRRRRFCCAWGCLGVLGAFAVLALIGYATSLKRRPDRVLVPAGFIGKIHVFHGVEGAPALPVVDGHNLIVVPPYGYVFTSSHVQAGWARDDYQYVDQDRHTPIPMGWWGKRGILFWQDEDEEAFVGTEDEYKRLRQGSSFRVGPIPNPDRRQRGRQLCFAQLARHDLHQADWHGADFLEASLQGANLRGANLQDAAGHYAHLEDADMRSIWLNRCDLLGVILKRADLRGADLRDAELEGADLRGARLERADLTGAQYDRYTRWPNGFVPAAHGAKLVAPQPYSRNPKRLIQALRAEGRLP